MSIIIKSFNVSVFPSFWCVLKTDVPMLFFVQVYLVLLHFTLLCFWIFHFLQMEGFWQPFSKSIGAIFPIAFAHFLSLCHILVFLAVFKMFEFL